MLKEVGGVCGRRRLVGRWLSATSPCLFSSHNKKALVERCGKGGENIDCNVTRKISR